MIHENEVLKDDTSVILDKYESQLGSSSIQKFELLRGLSFYNWQNSEYTRTFNHAIGLPEKNGQPMPLFDYEQLVFDTLQTNKHVWIKKATGLGVTEFMLRYMAWLCFRGCATISSKSPAIQLGSQMCIVTGPRVSNHTYRQDERTISTKYPNAV